MTNEMRLQGIGLVEGTPAGELKIGDIIRWNYGSISKVVAIEFTASGKTIKCKLESMDRNGNTEIYDRDMRVNRLVNIVASGETVLTGAKAWEIAAAVEEVAAEVAPAAEVDFIENAIKKLEKQHKEKRSQRIRAAKKSFMLEQLDNYIEFFFSEKEIEPVEYEIEYNGLKHFINTAYVIESIKAAPENEKKAIVRELKKIDFFNSDVNRYFSFLAELLVKEKYEYN